VFTALYGITESGAVLVRPDGIVAWRAVDADEASEAEITEALLCLVGGGMLSSELPAPVGTIA
jgi:putative polyketide hydroxylase